jgi:hypothetical protein
MMDFFFLPYVDKLYITKIHHAFEGDTFFPEIDMTNWKEIKRLMRILTSIFFIIVVSHIHGNNTYMGFFHPLNLIKKIDVRIRINLFIYIHQYKFIDEIR